MSEANLEIVQKDPTLYNDDLAPVPRDKRSWGWFEIFNVWANDVQSLFGYALAASLFITYGLNGWAVFAAIVIAGLIVMGLVNLAGRPSVKYGIPYPVMARVAMGVRGANFPAMVRGIVAIFWYGVQTYFASTAIALLINSLFGLGEGASFLGMTTVGWISFIVVWAFQIYLFWKGIGRRRASGRGRQHLLRHRRLCRRLVFRLHGHHRHDDRLFRRRHHQFRRLLALRAQ